MQGLGGTELSETLIRCPSDGGPENDRVRWSLGATAVVVVWVELIVVAWVREKDL